jgi:phage terminase large subunit
MPAWSYMERGGRHAELIWHRRFGKDEICLHWAAIAAFQRPAGYWHMLPMASQARKAIWDAVNPHSGKRRIDEAFPAELRETTLNNEMMIKFKNGSTWQVVGSDNFNSLVGSPPAGIVYSEWALANPMSRAILRPIIKENKGWQLFITTPRGKNHAHKTYEAARKDPDAFAEKLTIRDTGVFTEAEIEAERDSYINDFGEEAGDALFRQEYMCDWDAAILGAYYGREMRMALEQGRVTDVPYDPDLPVHTAWDIGRTDDLVIWFFQVCFGRIMLIDYFAEPGHSPETIASVIHGKPYRYGDHFMPWDVVPKTFASGGRSAVEQLFALGVRGKVVPNLTVQDGVQAVRKALPKCYFDETNCELGLESLRQYQRSYDPDRRIFRDIPLHNWASHGADAFRMLALAWREMKPADKPAPPKFFNDLTANEVFWPAQSNGQRYERI